MLNALFAGIRGLVSYGLIGLGIGAVISAVQACGAGPPSKLADQVVRTAEFTAVFSCLGFVAGFVSAYLLDKPDPDRQLPGDFSR